MRRFSHEVLNREVLGSTFSTGIILFPSIEGVKVSGTDLHSDLEVMVQGFQVTEILPDLNAEPLACSHILS